MSLRDDERLDEATFSLISIQAPQCVVLCSHIRDFFPLIIEDAASAFVVERLESPSLQAPG